MKTLLVEYAAKDLFERARHGKEKRSSLLDGDSTCFTLDIYRRHAIEKVHHAKVVCAPHLPDGDWDVIRFRTGPKLMSGELALDLLQECHRLADKCGAKVEVDYVGKERDKNALLEKIKSDPERVRNFAAHYKASVPGAPAIELVSYPGCFCHRRTDEGGLALAEVVSAELRARRQGVESDKSSSSPPIRLLDMGCGNGLVGFLVASAVKGVELVMVDSHSRAIEAARENAGTLGVPAEAILADNGIPSRMDGTFDVFVGNPPYYSEYRIAELFCETARRALKPGGIAYMVCKNAEGLRPVVEKYFPQIETLHRRGYAVLRVG